MVIHATEAIPAGVLWVDIVNPTNEEELSVERQLGIQIPTREEIWKNQALNRFYQENNVSYMTAALITKVDSPYPQTSSVTFILASTFLVTIRYIAPTSFNIFTHRITKNPQKFSTGSDVLEGLLEEIITRVAYNSEIVVGELDKLSHDIFDLNAMENCRKNPSQMMKEILARLGKCADLNSKISDSLHSLSRLLNFFNQLQGNSKEVSKGIRMLVSDTAALAHQTDFLSDKVNFQLDATLGMINVEQNMIVKIFSIVTVFFLPPTLISSLYGMNFRHMPELEWIYGYPMAVGMMVMCAVIPYLYFRRKGWL